MEFAKKYYDDFFKTHGPDVHLDPVRFSKIASLCKGSVLDLGCGSGHLSDFYKGEYTGVDISSVAVGLAKEFRRKDAKFLLADVCDPSWSVLTPFDTIVIAEVLEHVQDVVVLFKNLDSIYKVGTRFIISVPNSDRVPDESHLRIFTVPELRKKFSEIGLVKFYNYPGFSDRILMTCDVGLKSDELISLAVIAKDEGKGLENLILSCIDFVDKIVISIDNKSSDSTCAIAERYADVFLRHEWKNSFAEARNSLIPHIKTKWSLYLDGHEYVKLPGNLSEALKKDVDGLNITIIMDDGTSFVFPRIIRRHVRWTAAVHNYPILKTWADFFDFVAVHDRENLQSAEAVEARNKQRSEMIFSILVDNFKKDKTDSRPLYYLGQQCVFEKKWAEAKKWYKKFLKVGTVKGERWTALYTLGLCSANLEQRWRSLWYFFKADDVLPGRWETHKRIAASYMNLGLWSQAAEYFVKALEVQVGNFSSYPEPRDDAETWDFLGRCFFNLHKNFEAKAAWTRSLELEKMKPAAKIFKDRLEVLERVLKML